MEDFWNRVTVKKECIHFLQAKSFSPYSEFSKQWIQEKGDRCELTINGFYRYDRIMEPLFRNETVSQEMKDWLFDVYMHYLTELEFRKGITWQEGKIWEHMRRLRDGVYGDEMREIFLELTGEEQYYIASTMERQASNRESVYLFSDCMVAVMHDGVVYKNKQRDKELLFYINQKKTSAGERKIAFMREMFMPLGYQLEVLWERHFGVLGYKQTLELGEIELI